ncbi:MAG: hypothetical protein V1706_06500 [Pseudomonadota bacterium]
MGTDSTGDHVYDLRRIEDVFACLEIISIARGAMFGVDPEIARRMEKVSDALGALAQVVMDGELAEPAGAAQHSGMTERVVAAEEKPSAVAANVDVLADLTAGDPQPASTGGKCAGPEQEGSIVDILTGEKIK